ncbi:putative glycosyl transferase, family 14 [Helianthus anomalus]
MALKLFLISFILTSLIFTMLYISTYLTSYNNNNIPILLNQSPVSTLVIPKSINNTRPYPVSFAYLISASKGDTSKLKRTIHALYHPANLYLIHLELDATHDEHQDIATFVSDNKVFQVVRNVFVVGKPNRVTYRGPTMLATTLHAMSMLLRIDDASWDWFINLSASDYPLVTQDDLISAFSVMPKHLNFVQHTSRLGWKLNKRGKPVMIDPGLYSSNKSEIWWAIKQRTLPTAFKLYTGSAWTILSRSFAEYCIVGWENLPRTLLLYYTNFVSSPEGYFQTVICNSKDYKNTTVNHDLHYITWDTPPKQHPRLLGPRDYRKMVLSSRPFARKFKHNNVVLDRIDRELLKRRPNHFTHGGWCSAGAAGKHQTCSSLNNDGFGVLKPGAGARRLRTLLTKLTSSPNFRKRQCK